MNLKVMLSSSRCFYFYVLDYNGILYYVPVHFIYEKLFIYCINDVRFASYAVIFIFTFQCNQFNSLNPHTTIIMSSKDMNFSSIIQRTASKGAEMESLVVPQGDESLPSKYFE